MPTSGRRQPRHPGVELKLTAGTTPQLLERLRGGVQDTALLTMPVDASDLVQVPVMREEWLLVMAPGHKLARTRRITPADLVGQPWVLFERGSSTRRAVDAMMDRNAIHPRIAMETENPESLKALAAIGMGLTILPYQALAREARHGTLRIPRSTGVTMVRLSAGHFSTQRRGAQVVVRSAGRPARR